jgi:hypothetical protein
MELQDFKGWYLLTGVEFSTIKPSRNSYSSDIGCCRFVLNNITYQITEDENDGYRSALEEVKVIADHQVKNTFEPAWVKAVYVSVKTKGDYHYNRDCDIIQFIDVITNKIVLEIGTENTDDYYPTYIDSFNPENMAINANLKQEIEI